MLDVCSIIFNAGFKRCITQRGSSQAILKFPWLICPGDASTFTPNARIHFCLQNYFDFKNLPYWIPYCAVVIVLIIWHFPLQDHHNCILIWLKSFLTKILLTLLLICMLNNLNYIL